MWLFHQITCGVVLTTSYFLIRRIFTIAEGQKTKLKQQKYPIILIEKSKKMVLQITFNE